MIATSQVICSRGIGERMFIKHISSTNINVIGARIKITIPMIVIRVI